MKREQLLEAAFAYKQTRLWKKLMDSELFAVALPDGEIGYCCVMGMIAEHIALSLYVGSGGLTTLRMLADPSWSMSESEFAIHENMYRQNCIQCAFENKDELAPTELEEVRQYAQTHGIRLRGANAFPQFVRYRPQRLPWPLNSEQDEVYLYEALLAAVEVARRVGKEGKDSVGLYPGIMAGQVVPLLTRSGKTFTWGEAVLPEPVEQVYPFPNCSNDLTVARLKKIKKRSAAWYCEVAMFPQPMHEEDDDSAPVFPYFLITVDAGDKIILETDLIVDYQNNAESMLVDLARVMQKNGVPSKICVRDDRTMALLKGFTAQIGISLVYEESLPLLDEVVADAFAKAYDIDEDLEEFANMLMELPPEQLATIPPELRRQLLRLDRDDFFPEELSKKIRSVLEEGDSLE